MNAVDDEIRHQPVFRKLVPNVVRMPRQHRMRAVPEMRRERRARRYGGGNLRRGGVGVADCRGDARLHHLLDVTRRLWPGGRERHDPYAILRGLLPAAELFEIGLAHPRTRMRAARPVLGRDVRAFHVEAIHRSAFRQSVFRAREIAKGRLHTFRRAGDHSRVEAGHPAGEQSANGVRDTFVRSQRVVIVDAREAVHLQIDPAGGQPKPRPGTTGTHSFDRRAELHFRFPAGERVCARTFHIASDLFTSLPQTACGKYRSLSGKKAVEKGWTREIPCGVCARPRAKNGESIRWLRGQDGESRGRWPFEVAQSSLLRFTSLLQFVPHARAPASRARPVSSR